MLSDTKICINLLVNVFHKYFTNTYTLLIKDCWSWKEHSFLQFFLKPFLLAQKFLGFSRELNEVLRLVGYKCDYMIIMILLGL